MATKRQNSARHTAPKAAQAAVNNGWRSRVHKPTETDPKKRVEAIHQAASLIKTDARSTRSRSAGIS